MINKKLAKELSQEILMDCISISNYKLNENEDFTEEEKQIIQIELKKQMDRIAKLFGYEEAWFS